MNDSNHPTPHTGGPNHQDSFYSYNDPLWVRDFQEALRELVGDELALPPPEGPRPPCVVGIKPKGQRDVSSLWGSALRVAILEAMAVRKTAHPLIREVWWDGAKVGEVARAPWQPLAWLSSKSRRIPFYSQTDAAVYTVAAHLGLDEACTDPLDGGGLG